jgi:CysZ protein
VAEPFGGRALAPLPAGGGLRAFVAGAETCLEGFRVVRSTARLRALAVAPALVNLALLVFLVYGVIAARPVIASWIVPDASGLMAFLAGAGALVAAVLMAFLLHPVLASILAAPFNDALSAAVERAVRQGSEAEPFALSRLAGDILRPIGHALRVALFRLAATAVLLPIALVPVAGPAFVFLVSAAFAAYDHVDLPAARARMSYAEKRALMRRNRAATLGFGSVAQALLLVPIVNVFLLPAAVAGGTLLYLRMRK